MARRRMMGETACTISPIMRLALLLLIWLAFVDARAAQSAWVYYNANHSLVYSNDNLGNHIPDFSYAGYGEGGVALPTNAPVVTNLSAVAGDNTAQIQGAINAVSARFPANGFRGVVLLNPGEYEVDGTLTLGASGVILRGSGNSPTGTVLHFLGASRQTFTFQGSGSISQTGGTYNITNDYVPLGTTNFNVASTSGLAVGDLVVVHRPVTQSWIDAIGMNVTNINWSPNSGLAFERTITAINGSQISLDIPLDNPIEQQWCTGYVYAVTESSGRITNSALEDLRLRSDFDDASTNWGNSRALNFDDCKNCWLRDIVVDNFYNGINSGNNAKWCTVQDCYFVSNTIPTTSAGGAAFGGSGQMLLWQRCGSSASTDYHVFVTQAAVPGPYVFLNFNSSGNGYDSGAHQRWAAGILVDNTTVASLNGSNTGIKLQNRGMAGSGQGYAAGYSVIYNGNSPGIINEIPSLTNNYNWVIGAAPGATFSHYSDDGVYDATNDLVNPRSLYLEQLRERLGGAAIENIGYPLFTITAAPLSQGVLIGSNAVFTVNVGDPTLMSNIVDLSVSGLPANMNAGLNTNSVTGDGAATLTLTASNSLAPGTYTLNIIGANAGLPHTSIVSLVVGNFSLAATPAVQTILPGGSTSFVLNIATNVTFTGSLALGISGLPTGMNATFSPAVLNGGGSSTLSVTTSTSTPVGDYDLVISATNGGNVVSTTAGLNLVTPAVNPGTMFWNAASGVDQDWSDAFNWTNVVNGGYGPPSANNEVMLTNIATVNSSALTAPGSGATVPANFNTFVNSNFTIASLTSLNNAASTTPNYHNISLVGGSTLSASGVQVGGDTVFDFGANNTVNLTLSGAGAGLLDDGILTVNETSANAGSHNAFLDMSALDNFSLTGNLKVGVEGGGNAHHATGVLYLAKTNVITINNNGNVGFYIGHNKTAAPAVSPAVYLGISNAIFLANSTGVMVGRADTPGSLLTFNPAWAGQNPVANFYGSSTTSRVATWNVGDNSANSDNSANPTSGTNDFSTGTINALVSVMELGVSCPAGASGTGNGVGTFTFAAGTVDVSTLELGVDTGNTGTSIGVGVMNVNGGLLNVDNALELGVSVSGSGGVPVGTLNLNGGTVQATNIVGGGLATVNLNSGLLNLAGGTMSGISSLAVGNGRTSPATLENALMISSTNTITIGTNGTLAGNTFMTAPQLVVDGTLSPGANGIGAMTNNGTITFWSGGSLMLGMQNVNGGPGIGWDYLQAGGQLNLQASGTSPFVINLESLGASGAGLVTNFNATTNDAWMIASAAGGIVNYNPNQFSVKTDGFQNSLAGGVFTVQTNGNSLELVFTAPLPPVIGSMTLTGTNLVVTGHGSVMNGTYCVLTDTNLLSPLSAWTPVATNSFDGSGGFIFTNNIIAGAQAFYSIKIMTGE